MIMRYVIMRVSETSFTFNKIREILCEISGSRAQAENEQRIE